MTTRSVENFDRKVGDIHASAKEIIQFSKVKFQFGQKGKTKQTRIKMYQSSESEVAGNNKYSFIF